MSLKGMSIWAAREVGAGLLCFVLGAGMIEVPETKVDGAPSCSHLLATLA